MATDRHARVAEATHCSNRGAYLRAENVPDDPPFNGDGIQMDCRPGGEIQIDGEPEFWTYPRSPTLVFSHLYREATGGHRGGPAGCALLPTILRKPGHILRDELIISLDPASRYDNAPSLAGTHGLNTGGRLQVRASSGTHVDGAMPRAVVQVR